MSVQDEIERLEAKLKAEGKLNFRDSASVLYGNYGESNTESGFFGNAARGAGERASDLAGNLSLGGADLADWLNSKVGEVIIGPEGIDYYSPDDIAAGKMEGKKHEVLRDFAKSASDVDLGYKSDFTVDKLLDSEGVWDAVKNTAGLIVEQGIVSAPDMVALITTAPAYLASRSTELSYQRAKNNGRDVPDAEDRAWGSATSLASVAIDKFGLKGVQAKGLADGFWKSIGIKAGVEAGTEGIQESIEYAGTNVGTDVGFDVKEMGKNALGGALGGLGMGAVFGIPSTLSQVEDVDNINQDIIDGKPLVPPPNEDQKKEEDTISEATGAPVADDQDPVDTNPKAKPPEPSEEIKNEAKAFLDKETEKSLKDTVGVVLKDGNYYDSAGKFIASKKQLEGELNVDNTGLPVNETLDEVKAKEDEVKLDAAIEEVKAEPQNEEKVAKVKEILDEQNQAEAERVAKTKEDFLANPKTPSMKGVKLSELQDIAESLGLAVEPTGNRKRPTAPQYREAINNHEEVIAAREDIKRGKVKSTDALNTEKQEAMVVSAPQSKVEADKVLNETIKVEEAKVTAEEKAKEAEENARVAAEQARLAEADKIAAEIQSKEEAKQKIIEATKKAINPFEGWVESDGTFMKFDENIMDMKEFTPNSKQRAAYYKSINKVDPELLSTEEKKTPAFAKAQRDYSKAKGELERGEITQADFDKAQAKFDTAKRKEEKVGVEAVKGETKQAEQDNTPVIPEGMAVTGQAEVDVAGETADLSHLEDVNSTFMDEDGIEMSAKEAFNRIQQRMDEAQELKVCINA